MTAMSDFDKQERAKKQNAARQKRHQEKLKANGLIRTWVPQAVAEAATTPEPEPMLKKISESDRHALKVGREAMAATGIKRMLLGLLLSL